MLKHRMPPAPIPLAITLIAFASLALVDGDIGQSATAKKVTQAAIGQFGSIDHVVNNAGIFSVKPFTNYTVNEFDSLVSTNLKGFIFITQLAVKQTLSQGTGGSVASITASLVDSPVAGLPASFPMITKGGLNAITRSFKASWWSVDAAIDGGRLEFWRPRFFRSAWLESFSDRGRNL